ncbi:exo-alpha-sialidase [Polynucleobacter sp. JS-Mosq-20-D10]|uniref:sialidase family protein n=1 Tax=Polynucleobacter sp. JS-Mosq-20-D10 TaxID=2576922 RepID=UPI001BFD280A|nr:sialidase family protein [Polynucleobacter sp. JS-Mosq-20-D10]QWE01080.1 exo-alpha-sialidase [Polynucleobacter sp. JS-Mosq-20-D10]
MSRVIAFCFLLLASVLGFLHIDSRPVWAPFASNYPINNVNQLDDASELTEDTKQVKVLKNTAPLKSLKHVQSSLLTDWLPDTGAPSVHAASLIALKDGAVRAFWFAGSREGAPDVVINTSVFDSQASRWSAPTVVVDRVSAEKGLSRYIAKLGNPVPVRMADGRMQLFFVTVSIGGWAGSSISSMISDDEGLTWGQPQRLISSPLINLSTLVKSPAISFVDGRLGLPAYHEWIARFGEFLRIDASQVIDKRRMSSGRGAIQPVVFADDPQEAQAFFRQTRSSSQPKQIPSSETKDAGQSWTTTKDLEIPNPNSALAALTLANGTRLMVLNNIESARYRLVMVMREPSSLQWQVVQVLEEDASLINDQHREFSYPYLISASGEDAHLAYTWNRTKIKHVYFPATWFKHAASSPKEKEVQ